MIKELFIKWRNSTSRFFYKYLAKPIFFSMDPEDIHDRMITLGTILGKTFLSRWCTSLFLSYSNKQLEQTIQGIHFKNPLGLAAGFDKNAQLIPLIQSVGFGFSEIGSITALPCEGNPKPRLWRLKRLKGLVVYYGLKNDGCAKISSRLENISFPLPIGGSIAKTNCKETVDKKVGIQDYLTSFRAIHSHVDYITLNISCPNVYGGQPFTKPKDLDALLTKIDTIKSKKPIFLKITPDLSTKELDALLKVIDKHRVHGLIFSNLTKKKNSPKLKQLLKENNIPDVGGISGPLVKYSSLELIRHTFKKTKGKYVLVGCGGVTSAQDAYEMIRAGASLIQLITGMIYEGPQVISEINRGLVKLLKEDGFENISEAIGQGLKD